MWILYFKNKESGKIIWECGFGWYILRRLEKLTKRKTEEILFVDKLETNWDSFQSCFFGYRGIIDEESIAAEGKVE